MDALAKTKAKRVTIHGEADLGSLDGIRGLQTTDDITNFLYSGDINKLLQVLAESHITDLSVAEPDLEEIFLHYYTDGGEA